MHTVVRALCMLFLALFVFPTGLMAQEVERGLATYYSPRLEGRRTSSGERLHKDSMTCAHRTHAFGTLLLVTNLKNGRQVVVRVNDRGPYARGRIIDLSYGAAKKLDVVNHGVARVEIEVVTPEDIPFKPKDKEPPAFDYGFEVLVPEPDDEGGWYNQTVKLNPKKVPTTSDVVRSKNKK